MIKLNDCEETMLKKFYKNCLLEHLHRDQEKISTQTLNIGYEMFYKAVRFLEGDNQDQSAFVEMIKFFYFGACDGCNGEYAEIIAAPMRKSGIEYIENKYRIDGKLSLEEKLELVLEW